MRADAQRNRDHLLSVALEVIAEQGANASLRDIARRADVGLATLYRHFPTRETLLEALLHTGFGKLAARAAQLASSESPAEALSCWLQEIVAVARTYRGVTVTMMAAIQDPKSALHDSCVAMQSAGTRLLARAQAEGVARSDIDGVDLFALVGALAWIGDQPALAKRADHLSSVIASSILER